MHELLPYSRTCCTPNPTTGIDGAKNVRFRGLTFENGCDTGIRVSDSEHVTLADCTIRQMSGRGVVISGGRLQCWSVAAGQAHGCLANGCKAAPVHPAGGCYGGPGGPPMTRERPREPTLRHQHDARVRGRVRAR